MHIFHSWKGVPCYDGDINKIDDRKPTKEDYGYLRKCRKCGMKSSKGWVTIKIPVFKIIQPYVTAYTSHGNEVYSSNCRTFALTTREVRLFKIWKNYGVVKKRK